MKTTITDIIYPYAYTDNKSDNRIKVHDISGNPRRGSTVEPDGRKWKVTGNSQSSDCVSGVCPIK